MIVEKEDRLCSTDVTILDMLHGITEHLIIRMMEIKEGMYLYVSYVITLYTQKKPIQLIEGTSIEIRIIEGIAVEMKEGMMIVKRKK